MPSRNHAQPDPTSSNAACADSPERATLVNLPETEDDTPLTCGVENDGRFGRQMSEVGARVASMAKPLKPNSTKGALKLQSLGQVLGSAEPLRDLADQARTRLNAGESEEQVRGFVLREGKRLRLCGPRSLLPILSRKVLRIPLRKLLHAVADQLTALAGKRTVGDAVNGILDEMGFDAWFCDYVVGWARTGEPGPFYGPTEGGVFPITVGKGSDATPMVIAAAGPFSDPREIARKFLDTCIDTFPDATWDRMGLNVEAARCVRLGREGRTDYEIAELLLDENEPGWRYVYENAAEWREHRKTEAKRVQKLRTRFWKDYGDSILAFVSPDSD